MNAPFDAFMSCQRAAHAVRTWSCKLSAVTETIELTHNPSSRLLSLEAALSSLANVLTHVAALPIRERQVFSALSTLARDTSYRVQSWAMVEVVYLEEYSTEHLAREDVIPSVELINSEQLAVAECETAIRRLALWVGVVL